MAMALPLGKVTLLVGAGLLGSALMKEGRVSNVSDFFSGAFKIVFKQIQQDDSRPSGGKPQNDSLMAQVNSLRQELQLLASNRPVTIVTGTSGARNYGVPVVVVIVVGYGYVWWKGWKLSDLMFATRRSLTDACSSVAKQLDQVSSSISAAKRHLSSRIDRVDCNVDECTELTSATKNEVSELRGDMKMFSMDVESVHRAVQTLETKIGRIEGKQDITTHGVHVLIDFVQTLDSRKAASLQGSASVFALEPPETAPTRTASLPPIIQEPQSPSSSNESPKGTRPLQTTVSGSGLKELQGISDTSKAIADTEVSKGGSQAEDPKNTGSSSSGWFKGKFPFGRAAILCRTHSASVSFKLDEQK